MISYICFAIGFLFAAIGAVGLFTGAGPGGLMGVAVGALFFYYGQQRRDRAAQARAHKKCPRCAELVKTEAAVCRFCQYAFQPPPSK